MSLGKVLYL